MKQMFLLALSGLIASTVAAAQNSALPESSNAETFTLTTADKITYPQATLIDCLPDSIDIEVVGSGDGKAALIHLPLEKLSAADQKKYNYNPDAARDFSQKIQEAINFKLQDILQEAINAGANANNTATSDNQLGQRWSYAIHAQRAAIGGVIEEEDPRGSLVRITTSFFGAQLPELVFVDGLWGTPQSQWMGILYPTGLQYHVDNAVVPVYSRTVEGAYALGWQYAAMYSAYLAHQQQSAAGTSNAGNSYFPAQPVTQPYYTTPTPVYLPGSIYYPAEQNPQPVYWYNNTYPQVTTPYLWSTPWYNQSTWTWRQPWTDQQRWQQQQPQVQKPAPWPGPNFFPTFGYHPASGKKPHGSVGGGKLYYPRYYY